MNVQLGANAGEVNPGLLGIGAKDRGCTALSVPDYQSPNQIGHVGQLNAHLSRGFTISVPSAWALVHVRVFVPSPSITHNDYPPRVPMFLFQKCRDSPGLCRHVFLKLVRLYQP